MTFSKCAQKKKIRISKGLTVIEMVVTIAIFTLAMGAVVGSILTFYRGTDFAIEQAFAVESARRGVDRMVRDIREATFADTGAFPIIAMSTTSLSFYSDIDRDASVERVRFFLDGDTFKKGVTNATGTPSAYILSTEEESIVSEHVQNGIEGTSIFEYFDSDGTLIATTTNIADVAFVRVSLIVNVNPVRLPNEFTLRSSATLRNLKTNL